MSDSDDHGELKAFLRGAKSLGDENGIVVSVKAPRRKAWEVKSVMEQSGAIDIVMDEKKANKDY